MGEAGPVLLFVLIFALVAVLIIHGILRAKKRREAWQQLAARHGCAFSPKDPFSIEDRYPQPLFQRGHSQSAYNVLHGAIDGRELRCFDYLYKITTGSGKNRHTHTYHFTCLLLAPPISFRRLRIRPESFLDRVGEFFGVDDIDFESDAFSRRFHVQCDDKRFAYDVLHARAMELLLECGDVCLEADGGSVLLYCSGQQRVPEDAERLIRSGLRFLDLIPNYMLEPVGGTR